MGSPLKNPPVYLVLGKVEFNPILAMDDYLPAVQEAFRKAGYPDFAAHRFTGVVLPEGDGAKPQLESQVLYQFGNAERTHTFLLNGHGLALQSGRYGHFEQFRQRFLEGVERVHDIVSLGFIDKVGLRYLDRVMPDAGDSLDAYLQSQAQGLNVVRGAVREHAYMESLQHIGSAQLMSRVIIQPDGMLTLPADIQLFNMVLEDRFVRYVGPSATLDNDAFLSERKDYGAASIGDCMQTLHEAIRDAFRAVVTEHALNRWSE